MRSTATRQRLLWAEASDSATGGVLPSGPLVGVCGTLSTASPTRFRSPIVAVFLTSMRSIQRYPGSLATATTRRNAVTYDLTRPESTGSAVQGARRCRVVARTSPEARPASTASMDRQVLASASPSPVSGHSVTTTGGSGSLPHYALDRRSSSPRGPSVGARALLERLSGWALSKLRAPFE